MSLVSRFSVSLSGSTIVDGKEISSGELTYDGEIDPIASLEAVKKYAPTIGALLEEVFGELIKPSAPQTAQVVEDWAKGFFGGDERKVNPNELDFDLKDQGNS